MPLLKAGLIGLTKSAAKEMALRGVTCNAIAPGFIDTDMTKELKPEIKAEILKQIPLKRLGHADDIANLCVYLSSYQAILQEKSLKLMAVSIFRSNQ